MVRNRRKIIIKYLKGNFFFDLLASLPFNIIYFYYKKNSYSICHTYERTSYIYYLSILKCLKSFKIFKIIQNKKNQLTSVIIDKVPDSAGNILNLTIQILLIIFGLHIISCIHIFIGQHAYPGWIFSNNYENFSILNLYLISFYYLITTLTTVGYGDVSSDSFEEIIFRIFLLAVGIICYSWLISNISNGINKQSYASINFENDAQILESIRQEHRDLPFEIYKEIKKHLEYKHFQQKIYDKNLLIDSLPFTLKNSLIFSMYAEELKNFNFFQGISNTSFLSDILYNFSPLICKKNEILLSENEIIEEVFFVREGRLSLEIPIDMSDPEKSANYYLSKEFMDYAFDFKENDSPKIIGTNISQNSISSLIIQKNDNILFSENDRNYSSKKNIENLENNVFYLKIFDIHKNEDYGAVHLFYGKRSPFALKAKTKRVLLYTIKDEEFTNVSDTYKNVIKRINKKEKKILKIIKNVLIRTIEKFCKSNGINFKEEYIKDIEKAKKELEKSKIKTDIMTSTSFLSTSNNEIDNEINESVRQFNISIMRVTSIGTLKQDVITFDRLKKDRDSITRIPKRSFNFRGSMGASIIQGIQPNYYRNVNSSKRLSNLNTDNINKSIYKSIIEQKKRFSCQMQDHRKSNFQNFVTNISKIDDSNSKSSSTMRNIDLNLTENDSKKSNITETTVKIKKEENEIENESIDSGPKTMKNLPKSLQISLKNKIKNCLKLNQNNENFKIEHISIEINNDLYKIKNNKNNFNLSNIDTHNKNISCCNLVNGEGITNISDNNYSDLFNIMNTKNKNTDVLSNKFPTRKRLKVFNKNKKNKNFKKESTKPSSRGSLSPNFSPKNISNLFKINNLSPIKNKRRKSSFSPNNIVTKYDQTLIHNTNNLNFTKNLSSNSADSFEIKRSYKNLNQITEGDYIKNKNLQIKTIKFIKNYEKEKILLKNTKKLKVQDLMKGNKEEDHFKKIEDEIHNAKTKIAKYLLKKNKIIEKDNENKSLKVDLDDSFSKKFKFGIKNNRIANDNKIDHNNSSSIGLNFLTVNPDDTLAKLNFNEAIKSDIKEDPKLKKANRMSLAYEKKK